MFFGWGQLQHVFIRHFCLGFLHGMVTSPFVQARVFTNGIGSGFLFYSSPLVRSLPYGSPSGDCLSVSGLGKLLLARVNHTGSDVRGASGAVMNPRAYPRQSANPEWWNWKGVFSCRWARKEHINRLEMRSILLALRWRVQHLGEADCRFVRLTDSYVSMSFFF